jgi:cell division protein FtsI (penicillin-binding protein 3)
VTTHRDMNRAHPWRRRVMLGAWMTAAAVICIRAGQIQGVQAGQWRALAESQHRSDKVVVAARGSVLDRDGTPLAVSRERFSVGVATPEITDGAAVRAELVDALGISAIKAVQLTDPTRRWRAVPGRYPPTVREQLAGLGGVHVARELERYHPHGDLARGVLGVVGDDVGRGGVEQAFEELLRGTPGREVIAHDNVGRAIPGERLVIDPPQAGGDVVLTIDIDLQEIARQALEESIATTEARGGDVLITDPNTGEILALVSIRDGQTAALSAINTPYEPGSTLKPFTVAGLLERDLVSLYDTVDGENGAWRVNGRTLHDVHGSGRMTIADALRTSSNVGIAKAAQSMSPGDQYENLRDFGLGTLTGIEIPGEVSGTLRRPDSWSSQSAVSLAIGYEVNVTPLQMAMAYGALANGGRIMQPHLVKEIRDGTGALIEAFQPRVVREVVSADVARRVGRVLEDVVEDGTGKSARLATFRVAGKSGTTRLYSPAGGYEQGAYWSSFVGFFPADAPQLVVFVKLERPKGIYYGGAVAGPVTRATMEAALAARSTPLDRAALLGSASRPVPLAGRAIARFASRTIDPPLPPVDVTSSSIGSGSEGAAGFGGTVQLPDVAGLPSRIAVRRLHALGLRVSRAGSGDILGTEPQAGARVLPGDTIRLRVRRRSDD